MPHSNLSRIRERLFRTNSYALHVTLKSGQTFGWQHDNDAWSGVIDHRWVEIRQASEGLGIRVTDPSPDAWSAITDYLQTDFDLVSALRTFPDDSILQTAIRRYPGLRLLRQDPWTCLASFLLSATKRIPQIQQVYQNLCRRFGRAVDPPSGHGDFFAFPSPDSLASAGEAELRKCRMGFRARYLYAAARHVAEGSFDLDALRRLPLQEARARLLSLPGVGRKIADCVLLFSCDQPRAFPVDVWIARTLRAHYFNARPVPLPKLQTFAEEHFGPHAGLAQQYLFHNARNPIDPAAPCQLALP